MKKKYLTTPEEILALKDTDTEIYKEDSKGYFKFIKGVLCFFSTDNSIVIGTDLGIGTGYLRTYILVEELVKEATEKDIGKLCWFWDYNEDMKFMSTLVRIDTDNPYSFCCRHGQFGHCIRLSPSEVAEITGYKVEE